MRIKCPRCGLVNKPGVKKCQSCGEDLTDLLDLDIDVDIQNRPDDVDPLSLDSIKKNRRRREKATASEIEQNSLDLNWRDELNRRVSEIKKERESKIRPEKDDIDNHSDEEIIRTRKRDTGSRNRIKDEILKAAEGSYRTIDDEEDIVREDRAGRSRKKTSKVFDDDHLEEYDLEHAEDDNTSGIEGYNEKPRQSGDYDQNISHDDEESYEDADDIPSEIPKDPDDVKRYLEEKVARRKRKVVGSGRALSEEYGYRPKSRGRTRDAEHEQVRHKTRDEESYIENEPTYESRTIYRPIDDVKPQTPSDRLLSEETQNLLNSKRIYAGLWDNIILLIITFAIIKLGANTTDVTIMQLLSASWFKLVVFYLVINGFYNIYFVGSNGQTIGKMIMHIRLMTVEGTQISFTRAFFHYVFSIVGWAFLGIGFFWFLFNRESRNWADMLLGVKTELFRN